MRLITRIILHCSATRPDWMGHLPLTDQVAEIRRWHRALGWSDIGYHWIIGRSGARQPGRPVARVGAHTQGENAHSIGICLIGGHGSAATDAPGRHFTAPQLMAAAELIAELRADHAWPTVHGHNEFAAKACPGFDAGVWWARCQDPTLEPMETS